MPIDFLPEELTGTAVSIRQALQTWKKTESKLADRFDALKSIVLPSFMKVADDILRRFQDRTKNPVCRFQDIPSELVTLEDLCMMNESCEKLEMVVTTLEIGEKVFETVRCMNSKTANMQVMRIVVNTMILGRKIVEYPEVTQKLVSDLSKIEPSIEDLKLLNLPPNILAAVMYQCKDIAKEDTAKEDTAKEDTFKEAEFGMAAKEEIVTAEEAQEKEFGIATKEDIDNEAILM